MRHRRSPRCFFLQHGSPLLPAIVLLTVTPCVDVAWGCITGEVVDPAQATRLWRDRLEADLAALSSGTLKESLEAADRSSSLFVRLSDEKADPSDPEPEEVAWRLSDALDMAADDFVGWSILDDFLGDSRGPFVDRMFRDALKSSSPNVRARAIAWFKDHEDEEASPLLEDLWDGGVPEWARADLMVALGHVGSTRHFEDFLRLTGAEDTEVALAALEALDALDDIRALPRLLDLATDSGRFLRIRAMGVLPSWPESDEAFNFLLAASRRKGEEKREAIRLLGAFRRPSGDERLLEVLAEPEESDLKVLAAEELKESDLPGVTEAFLDLIRRAEGEDRDWLVPTILHILQNRDDPEALPGLRALAPGIEQESREPLEDLIAFLERPDRTGSHSKVIRTSCSFRSPDPDDPATWHVVAPAGFRSIRCAEEPGIAGESWLETRIPDGEIVSLWSRFDRDGDIWAEVDTPDSICWVPMRLLERGAGGAEASTPDPLNPELDVPAVALDSKLARRLIKAGTLEVLDMEDDAAGVAFHLELGGSSLVSLLEALRDDAPRKAEALLDDVLETIDFDELAPDESEEDAQESDVEEVD